MDRLTSDVGKIAGRKFCQRRQTGILFAIGLSLGGGIFFWLLQNQNLVIPYHSIGAQQFFDQPKQLKTIRTSTMKQQLLNLSTLLLDYNDPNKLREYEAFHSRQSDYSVDILIIGSLQQTELPATQLKTWASHKSIRHFILATEEDSPEPNCLQEMNNSLIEHVKFCKGRKHERYADLGGDDNLLIRYWTNAYARIEWLQKKKNPAGWLCAQPRFGYAFVKMLQLYQEHHNFPDYLVVADDDMYLDMDAFTEVYLIEPKEDQSATPENMLIPPPNIPTVWAGCRVRPPIHQINFTFPFGGYGTFFSTAALKRMVTPLYCDSRNHQTSSNKDEVAHTAEAVSFQKEACQRLKPNMTNIGEQKYYKPGMSVRDIVLAYLQQEERFCAHSDWFLAYFVNYYNISRHTIHEKVFPGKPWRFDDFMENVPESRLHTISYQELDDSEVYRQPGGNCAYNGQLECNASAFICHYVNSAVMERVFAAKQNMSSLHPV